MTQLYMIKNWKVISILVALVLMALAILGVFGRLAPWLATLFVIGAAIIIAGTAIAVYIRRDDQRRLAKSLRDTLLKRRWEERQRREW